MVPYPCCRCRCRCQRRTLWQIFHLFFSPFSGTFYNLQSQILSEMKDENGKMSDFITHETVFVLQKLNLRHVRSKCAPHTIMIIHRNSFEYTDFSAPKLSTFAWSPLIMPLHLPHSLTHSLSLPIFHIHSDFLLDWNCSIYIIILLQCHVIMGIASPRTYFEPRTYIFFFRANAGTAYTFSLKFMIFNFGIKSKCVIALASNS